MERRFQRKFEWRELPAVLAEGLRRLRGAGVELAEPVFSSGDTGTYTSYKLRFVMHGGATKRPARFCILLDFPHKSGSTPPVDGATSTCALGEGSAALANQTTSHFPTQRVSIYGSEKRALERAEPRYKTILGQLSRRMPARLPCNRDACARQPPTRLLSGTSNSRGSPTKAALELKRPPAKCFLKKASALSRSLRNAPPSAYSLRRDSRARPVGVRTRTARRVAAGTCVGQRRSRSCLLGKVPRSRTRLPRLATTTVWNPQHNSATSLGLP